MDQRVDRSLIREAIRLFICRDVATEAGDEAQESEMHIALDRHIQKLTDIEHNLYSNIWCDAARIELALDVALRLHESEFTLRALSPDQASHSCSNPTLYGWTTYARR